MSRIPARALPLLAAAAATLVWSSAFAAVAHGLRAFAPGELALLRFGIASLALVVPVLTGAIRLPPRRDWPAVALLGFVGLTVYQLAFCQALTQASAGAVAVVIALAPGVTAAFAALRLRERLGRRALLGLTVAFGGALLAAAGSGRAITFEPRVLYALVAVLATSVYFVWQKPLLARTTPIGFTTLSIFFGTLGLLPFGRNLPHALALVPWPQLASAVYLGLVPTVLGYFAWNYALSRAPAARVSSFLYAQPLLAGVMAWAWLGQAPGALVLAGGALAIGGVVLTVSGRSIATPRAEHEPHPRLALCTCAAVLPRALIQIR